MTTTSTEPVSLASRRFAAEIVDMHARMRVRGLPSAIVGDPLLRLDGYGDGLTTLTVRESQLPERYLRAVMGFRLAQFLDMGWMDPDLVHRLGLYHEPIADGPGPETIHTLTLDAGGRIVGYIGLVGSPDAVGLGLDSPDRGLFPVEAAHHVDLLADFAVPGLTTHNVWEIKRFVRDRFMERGPIRDRVPWHLILALMRVGSRLDEIQIVCGDSRENGALRHLRLIGFDPFTIEDTAPSLPHDQLMWPSYERPQLAIPFIARVPDDLEPTMEAIDAGLALESAPGWQRRAIELVAAQRYAAVA